MSRLSLWLNRVDDVGDGKKAIGSKISGQRDHISKGGSC